MTGDDNSVVTETEGASSDTTYPSVLEPAAGTDETEEDDEEEVTVLDPDHPLMKRFQNALNLQLQKQKGKKDLLTKISSNK